ncbi:MAG: polysaccharide pyruvyl transferase family protein [Solirubrobacterales bacterium]
MAPSIDHVISNLKAAPGELAFDAKIGGAEKRIWFRSESAVTPCPEAALATCLMPAMASGGRLTMSEPISPRVLRTQREFQAVQRAWSLSWPFGDHPLEEVEVTAPTRTAAVEQPVGRVAAFFSGGVDSWSTVLSNPDLTDLIFVRGLDILPQLAHQEGLAERVEARLREAADELGLTLHTVETNLREISEPNGPEHPVARWEAYYGCAVAAVALFLGRAFDRVLITGDSDYEVQPTIGANWMVDQLWSTEELEIVDAGGRFNRAERTELIASHPLVQRTLRVCWQNPDGAYNCGHCRKCLTTMATLEAFDRLEAVETFPSQLDLEALAAAEINQPAFLSIWEDLLDATRRSGKPELEAAVATAVRDGKRRLGLPASFRSRNSLGPPPSGRAGGGPRLLATPAVAEKLAVAPAAAILVGSYDGSGNFGDIAQLDAALGLLDRLGPDLLVLPVVERQFAASHEKLAGELTNQPRDVLYFDDGGAGGDDLVPINPPQGVSPAISYLYGGGFLNPSWGDRKLAMVAAVEDLLGNAGRVIRIASGQQVDKTWIESLDPARSELLRRFELWGARDDDSAAALAGLAAPNEAFNGGDDSIGILAAIGGAEASDPTSAAIEVNVHFAEHEWVTDSPDSVREFDVRLLAELSRLAGRRLRVRPLLAYLDPRIDERQGLERFVAACAGSDIELAEPLVLRPARIAELSGDLGGAALTLSSSYHVALTSLLLAIPTAILRDNDYYAQKAQGLLSDFGLPPEFALRSSGDPERAAAAIAPHLLDPDLHRQMRRRLETAATRIRQRRMDSEAALLATVAAAALGANGTAVAPALSPAPENGRVAAAEQRAAEVEEKLDEVLGSRSWALTAPLRRLRRSA